MCFLACLSHFKLFLTFFKFSLPFSKMSLGNGFDKNRESIITRIIWPVYNVFAKPHLNASLINLKIMTRHNLPGQLGISVRHVGHFSRRVAQRADDVAQGQ
jgi:hypothetical protein